MKMLRVLLFLALATGFSPAAEDTDTVEAEKSAPAEEMVITAAQAAPGGETLSLEGLEKKARDMRLPGITLAEGISQATGTAISPLLGVSAVGAWKYFQTPVELRHLLPWYCQPWAWGTAFVILGFIFIKDVLGTADPALIKKPFDFAELYEDKASALLALVGFIPLITAAMAEATAIPLRSSAEAGVPAALGLAAVAGPGMPEVGWVKMAIYLPLMMGCFLVVWLSSHAINVLIALSPFGMVDAMLKAAKAALMLVVAGATYLHPLLGLAVCLPIILLAMMLSGWAFRFMVFGSVFGWDLLLRRKAKPDQIKSGVKCFSARRLPGAPKRTYGTLSVNTLGMPVFRHRKWLIMPAQEVAMDPPPDGIITGVVHPSITSTHGLGAPLPVYLLPPRYRNCTAEIGQYLGIQNVSESGFKRGLGNVRLWFSEVLVMTSGPGPGNVTAAGNPARPPLPPTA